MKKNFLLLLMLCFYSSITLGSGVYPAPGYSNYRWRNDNGNEKNASVSTSSLLSPNKNIRLRFAFAAVDGPLSLNGKLYYSKNGGPRVEITSSDAADFRFASSTFVTNGQATTSLIPPYDDEGNNLYQFIPGKVIAAVINGSVSLPAGRYTELEYVIRPTVHASRGSVYIFSSGVNFSYYTSYPYLRTQTSYPNTPVDNGSDDVTDFALDVFTGNKTHEVLKVIDNDPNTVAKFYPDELPTFEVSLKDPAVVKSISFTCADSVSLFSPRTVDVRAGNLYGTAHVELGSTYFDFASDGQRMTLNFKNNKAFTYYRITIGMRSPQPLKIAEMELLRTPSVDVKSLVQERMGLRNKVSWQAANEKNIKGFRLQKRFKRGDDTGPWKTVAEIARSANADTTYRTYSVYENDLTRMVEYRVAYMERGQFTTSNSLFTWVAPEVKLVGGSAKVLGNKVELKFKTEYEVFNTQFIGEHSIDSGKTWTSKVITGGGTTGPKTYTLTDDAPAVGLNLYRLRYNSNFNNVVTESLAVIYNANAGTASILKLGVYPNPVVNDINFTLSDYKGKSFEATVTDRMGIKLLSKTINTNTEGVYKLSFNVKPKTGIYYLTVKGNGLVGSAGLSVQ